MWGNSKYIKEGGKKATTNISYTTTKERQGPGRRLGWFSTCEKSERHNKKYLWRGGWWVQKTSNGAKEGAKKSERYSHLWNQNVNEELEDMPETQQGWAKPSKSTSTSEASSKIATIIVQASRERNARDLEIVDATTERRHLMAAWFVAVAKHLRNDRSEGDLGVATTTNERRHQTVVGTVAEIMQAC